MKRSFGSPYAELSPTQRAQLAAFQAHLLNYNRKINLISRNTASDFEERHILHALGLSIKAFPPGSSVVDWGTGGGLPAVPLAIRFPEVTFHAVDAVEKKIRVVQAVARRMGLDNLYPWAGRAEAWTGQAHYAVSRATAPLADLWRWYIRVRVPMPDTLQPASDAFWQPGLICLKGGDLAAEIADLQEAYPETTVSQTPLEPVLGRSYFQDKFIVAVQDSPS